MLHLLKFSSPILWKVAHSASGILVGKVIPSPRAVFTGINHSQALGPITLQNVDSDDFPSLAPLLCCPASPKTNPQGHCGCFQTLELWTAQGSTLGSKKIILLNEVNMHHLLVLSKNFISYLTLPAITCYGARAICDTRREKRDSGRKVSIQRRRKVYGTWKGNSISKSRMHPDWFDSSC